MGIGALFPFSRGHTETGSIDHEPWSFGAEVFIHAPEESTLFICMNAN
jgi:alpha-glucosidase (family GH31 glycosyl hydrolase)